MIVNFLSFGYRHGEPEADLIIDARKLKNPYGVERLKNLTGLNKEVELFVRHDPRWEEWFPPSLKMAEGLIHHSMENGAKEITIAVGCVGGKHRSVVGVMALAANVSQSMKTENFWTTNIRHRELGKGFPRK